jgi:hypothetical protein
LNYTRIYSYDVMDTLYIYQAIPDMVHMVIVGAPDMKACGARNDTNFLESETAASPGTWQTGTKGCVQKPGFDEGIPVWKMFAFHFWSGPASPLGGQWTLAPEDYAGLGIGDNQYLGE